MGGASVTMVTYLVTNVFSFFIAVKPQDKIVNTLTLKYVNIKLLIERGKHSSFGG